MGAWQLLVVPLMTALGILFLQAQLLAPGLGLLVLAALIPHAEATARQYQVWCRQIREDAVADMPELAHAMAVQEAARFNARPATVGAGILGSVTAAAGSASLDGLAVDAYETRA